MTELTKLEAELVLKSLERLEKGQEQLIDLQAQTNDRLDHLDDCIDGAKLAIKDLETLIKSAVPDGDVKGHHDYHLGQMQKWNFWNKIKTSVVGKVLEVCVIGLGGWVVLTLWGGFKIARVS